MLAGEGWDSFVSYTQADHAWAERIAWVLAEDGHTQTAKIMAPGSWREWRAKSEIPGPVGQGHGLTIGWTVDL